MTPRLSTFFVSAHGIKLGIPRLKQYLAYDQSERPVGIQIFGYEVEVLAEAAKIIEIDIILQ